MHVLDDEWKQFALRCRELGLPDDARMDDYLEFLEAFTSAVRSRAEQEISERERHKHTLDQLSGDELHAAVDELAHERMRDAADKLAKLLLEGI